MRRFLSFTLLLLFAVAPASADKARILEQKPGSITFVVDENLPEPRNEFLTGWEHDDEYIACSFGDSPILIADNPFYTGMIKAFADHRPITLSPDVIWMLICQAFSHDVNADPEKFRDKLVDFEGKIDLVVETGVPLYDPAFDWTAAIDGFAQRIDDNTINDVAKIIKADFSTTGTVERLASEIVLMETTKSFFEFILMYAGCGFPSVTLTGTVDDWQAVLDKTAQLHKLGAGRWAKELKPILEEFVQAAKGNPDQAFWQDIVMQNTPDRLRGGICSDDEPTELDGWFLKFLPYDKDGKPTPATVPHNYERMPKQMSSVPVKYVELDPTTGQVIQTIDLELSGGIVGYSADESGCVSFRLGWTVDESESQQTIEKIKQEGGWLFLRVSKVPEEVRVLQHYDHLSLEFTGKVEIPKWLYDLDIDYLEIKGNVSPALKRKLKRHFDVRFR